MSGGVELNFSLFELITGTINLHVWELVNQYAYSIYGYFSAMMASIATVYFLYKLILAGKNGEEGTIKQILYEMFFLGMLILICSQGYVLKWIVFPINNLRDTLITMLSGEISWFEMIEAAIKRSEAKLSDIGVTEIANALIAIILLIVYITLIGQYLAIYTRSLIAIAVISIAAPCVVSLIFIEFFKNGLKQIFVSLIKHNLTIVVASFMIDFSVKLSGNFIATADIDLLSFALAILIPILFIIAMPHASAMVNDFCGVGSDNMASEAQTGANVARTMTGVTAIGAAVGYARGKFGSLAKQGAMSGGKKAINAIKERFSKDKDE